MKFRFLVSGSALSPERVEAIRRSIEDVGLRLTSGVILVELLPADQTIRLVSVDDSGLCYCSAAPGPHGAHLQSGVPGPLPIVPPTALRCGHCGELVTGEQAWGHKCGAKSARRSLMPRLPLTLYGPLDIVFVFGGCFGIGFMVCKVLERLAT